MDAHQRGGGGPPPDPNATKARLEIQELNTALHALAEAFPNVRPEVFREMLTALSKESRAQVVAEHLLRRGDKWIRGRWRLDDLDSRSDLASASSEQVDNEPRRNDAYKGKSLDRSSGAGRGGRNGKEGDDYRGPDKVGVPLVPLEETFRTPSYMKAVSTALRNEFGGLSQSTINGVLAEQNHCYTLARPILAALAAKTWRASISNLVMRAFGFGTGQGAGRSGATSGKSKSGDPSTTNKSHFMLQWAPGSLDHKMSKRPFLKNTGDAELDEELRITVLQPLLDQQRDRENSISLELALLLNEHEAELAGAMYECQVCFADVTFEQAAFCSGSVTEGHVICFECIQRAVSEAVYGQSWDLTIDHARGQLACIAPSDEPCNGCIPQYLAERAVLAGKGGSKMWEQLQTRLANEALQSCKLPLVHCPFCPYVEIDALYLPSKPIWSLNFYKPIHAILFLLLGILAATLSTLFVALLYIIIILPLSLLLKLNITHTTILAYLAKTWTASLKTNIRRQHLAQRFVCRSPACRRASCLDCRKRWHDPHRCHESAALSLRTTIEAARTAALKRTCPRCALSFVKASGCNKMVCVCGYSMCYVCRQGLKGKRSDATDGAGAANDAAGDQADLQRGGAGAGAGAGARGVQAGAVDNEEGYRHFCQHFRPNGGRCMECDKCDLYRAEDEDEVVARAGQIAEAEWRERNGIAWDMKLPPEDDDNRASGGGGGGSRKRRRGTTGSRGSPWPTIDQSTFKSVWSFFKGLSLQRVLEWWVSQVLICRLQPRSDSELRPEGN